MNCPKCGAEMKTVQSIPGHDSQLRRRECSFEGCGHAMVTVEVAAAEVLLRRALNTWKQGLSKKKNTGVLNLN